MRDSDLLKDLLSRELTRLRQAATDSDGELDADQVDALERLARLVDIADRTEDKPRPRRWPVSALSPTEKPPMPGQRERASSAGPTSVVECHALKMIQDLL